MDGGKDGPRLNDGIGSGNDNDDGGGEGSMNSEFDGKFEATTRNQGKLRGDIYSKAVCTRSVFWSVCLFEYRQRLGKSEIDLKLLMCPLGQGFVQTKAVRHRRRGILIHDRLISYLLIWLPLQQRRTLPAHHHSNSTDSHIHAATGSVSLIMLRLTHLQIPKDSGHGLPQSPRRAIACAHRAQEIPPRP